jgi:hypothetical protein
MNFWNIQSTFRAAIKYFWLVVICMVTFSCSFKHKTKSMDISDFIGRQSDLHSFIDGNFDPVEYEGFENPVHPFKVDFINRIGSLKFCTMPIQQCWVRKVDTLYAFFIIVKTTADVQKNISNRYGKYDISASITTQGVPVGGQIFMWHSEQLDIEVSSYFNTFKIPKYEKCDLIICRNMTRRQLTGRPDD